MAELWKHLPESNLEVSNLGNYRAVEGFIKARINNGYLILGFTTTSGRKSIGLHRIVCILFLGVNKEKLHVNHKDGNKLNNCLENLEWVTPKENAYHALKNGLAFGKFKQIHVESIKRMFSKGYSIDDISYAFKVAPHRVKAIVS